MLSLVFSFVMLELLTVAWIDFKTEKISNKWILVNAVCAISLHIFARPLYPFSWEVLIFPLGFIVIGFFLYLLNVMGAGDSKFLASLFLIVPIEFHMPFFEKLVISSIAVGAILFSYRVYKNGPELKAYFVGHYWEGIRKTLQSRFSYAPVIFLAWIILGFNIW
jgi:prepilin peptidase CpaA